MKPNHADERVANEIRSTARGARLGAIAASFVGLALIGVALLRSDSWVLWGLTVAFLISAALTTFDKRVVQAKMGGITFTRIGPFQEIGPETQGPRAWIAAIYWIHIGLLIALFVINWKSGVLICIGGFTLAATGFLETAGGILLAPFRDRH